ncbi:MAG TPA: metal ABC transporter ATP-binding protein [Candidatus Nitrosopelagicus sp.]|jgi:zinc transport system ATP-binding protein|nr:metal ABC transporter ATP-binding protein [Candidatus Nitrosopelagicus sp.]
MLLTFFTFINNQAQILDMIVDIENLSVDYSGINALEEISFGIDDGDFLGIIGPNGAGKSTLFRCMLGLHTQYDGTIKFFDQNIKDSKKYLSQIGYVPQKPVVDKNFPATIREIVSMSQKSNDSKKVDEALQKVWMHELADRRVGDLSIGQQQRVFIAKALVNSPKILILDEPVIGLDVYNQDLFFQILSELNSKEKISIIWSSHDLDAVERLANKVACLNKTLFFHGISQEFFSDDEMLKKYSETSMQMHMHHH